MLVLVVAGYLAVHNGLLGPIADAFSSAATGGSSGGTESNGGSSGDGSGTGTGTGSGSGSGAVGDESPVVTDPAVFDTTALALLATLPVKGRAPSTGYDRVGDFGEAWTDVDRNGCDTREDILTRDLTATDIAADCDVESGTLASPYTGETIAFTRGYDTSAEVQIDHMVALSDAWQTGAQQLTQAQRVSLANDPVNLLAVDGPSNQQKSDSDAASWLPANKSYRCTYVAHQVSVKVEYALWVTPAEHEAMARILAACPTMAAPVSPFVGGR
ncbi:uncharacterized protein DUF1524 [Frondihabitans sp. PhB188]|uniref:HNH endonuclease family protein n=1 Tax=Frondihabitans sp. PhB188 TaxID=2485200 RepID=UPI000FAD251C|nr:HNH endonuclease family protein [Frondihabitans sp. PhB188]ROQ40741.1 uncharacterized protein DUF1524 [Frondihabitans sp. PhB188]